MTNFIEAIHILSGTNITANNLNRAHELLLSVVQQYEEIYGQKNMVFNVHLLLHTAKCVEKLGPLFTYSNYSTEDYIGHLVSFVKGPTDVLSQICDRYCLEKNLYSVAQQSNATKEFMHRIETRQFAVITKFQNYLLIGKCRRILCDDDNDWIFDRLDIERTDVILSYRAILLNSNSNVYFESETEQTKKKRTYDSFVCNENGIYGTIKLIILARSQVYFIVDAIYEADKSIGSFMTILKRKEQTNSDDRLLEIPSHFATKFAFIQTETIIACSKFPNVFERN